jgi:hypothetical protein
VRVTPHPRGIATAFAAAGLVALLAGCEQTVQAAAAEPATSPPALETLVPVANGLAAEQETEAAAAVEAARIAVEQEAARLAAEQEAARMAAEQAAADAAAPAQAAPRARGRSSGRTASPQEGPPNDGPLYPNNGLPADEWLDPVTSEHIWPGKYTAGEWVHVVDGACWLEGTTYYASCTAIWSDGYSKRLQHSLQGYPLRMFSVGWVEHNYGAAYGGRVYEEDRAIPCPMPDGY